MGLTEEQRRLVVETWKEAAGDDCGATVGKDMLTRHLKDHPDMITVFGYPPGPWDPNNNAHLVDLGKRIMAQVSVTVSTLEDEAKMVADLKELGVRHKKFGDGNLKAEYFPPMGETFVWAIEKNIGGKLSPAAKEAWGAAYNAISGTIVAGMES